MGTTPKRLGVAIILAARFNNDTKSASQLVQLDLAFES